MTKETPNTIPSNYIPGQDPLDDYIAEQLKAAADSIPLSDDVKCRVEQKLSDLKMQESKNERGAVPSARLGLTSLFGMGRGDPQRYNHQNIGWTTLELKF